MIGLSLRHAAQGRILSCLVSDGTPGQNAASVSATGTANISAVTASNIFAGLLKAIQVRAVFSPVFPLLALAKCIHVMHLSYRTNLLANPPAAKSRRITVICTGKRFNIGKDANSW